jgi:hypothetical protein
MRVAARRMRMVDDNSADPVCGTARCRPYGESAPVSRTNNLRQCSCEVVRPLANQRYESPRASRLVDGL